MPVILRKMPLTVPSPALASAKPEQPQKAVLVQLTPFGKTIEVRLVQLLKVVPVKVTAVV